MIGRLIVVAAGGLLISALPATAQSCQVAITEFRGIVNLQVVALAQDGIVRDFIGRRTSS